MLILLCLLVYGVIAAYLGFRRGCNAMLNYVSNNPHTWPKIIKANKES